MGSLITIGYSGREIAEFLALLRANDVDVVCDVRSTPYSRFRPEFSRAEFKQHLNSAGIKYKFLGDELGARPKDRSCYLNGQATYQLISQSSFFQAGLERLRTGVSRLKLALVCSEADPIECHRAVLVCRQMPDLQERIEHVREDGSIETQYMFDERLVKRHNLVPLPLIPDERDWEAAVEEAYERQSASIAYREREWPTKELVS